MTPAVGYTEMKDSGIEWVGMIPKDWDINILFQLVSQVKNKNKDLTETNLLSLSYGKIKRKNIDHTDGLIPASFDSYNIIDTGDIVLRLTDLQNDQTSLRVGRSTEKGIITSAYITLRPVNLKTSKFLYYLLHAFDIRKGFYGMGAGVRQGLTYDEVKVLKLPLPSISEQTAIATYLDTQCAKIDEIIAEAKASIEDYKQWKASIIYEAVTKGLDPKAEMKDSGIPHAGEIPQNWSVLPIKYVAMLDAKCDKSGLSEETKVSFAPMECIRNDTRIAKVAPVGKDNGTYSSFYDGDIAIAKVTPCFENGNICIMENLEHGYAFGSSELFSIRPKNINNRYLLYCMQTPYFVANGAATMTGVGGLKRVSSYYMKNALIPLPSQHEQDSIVAYLDNKSKTIVELIAEKQCLITDLEAYKKSLIYEVVTGKRRVI